MEYQKFIPEGWNLEEKAYTHKNLEEAYEEGKVISGIVNSCDENYNLHVNLGNNIFGIIPREEIEAINLSENGIPKPNICTGKVNKVVQFKVKGITEEMQYILSRKDVGLDAVKWIKEDLCVGNLVHGIIKNIRPYGVFVEIGGGIVGLLHIEDISVARIKTPYERFDIGDKIDVMIKNIDKESGRVLLTYKELLGTWEENAVEFEEGQVVQGIVREIEKNKNGIFIEVKPNLVGLADYIDGTEYGQTVDVVIRRINLEKKKLKLVILNNA